MPHRKAPDCHHEVRTAHRCHFGPCPPCRQVCSKKLSKCEHTCPAACHSAILARIQEKVWIYPVRWNTSYMFLSCMFEVKRLKNNLICQQDVRTGPWEPKPESRIEMVAKPCPPCQVPVPVSCLGEHEVRVISHVKNIFEHVLYINLFKYDTKL